eukprot:Lithocolla_globosa_v1_NODE_3_length_14236_cov_22.745998.p13 type:complete len:140 gc:universal NODE_3_length_14236_cov_22.745998:4595-4176(-)
MDCFVDVLPSQWLQPRTSACRFALPHPALHWSYDGPVVSCHLFVGGSPLGRLQHLPAAILGLHIFPPQTQLRVCFRTDAAQLFGSHWKQGHRIRTSLHPLRRARASSQLQRPCQRSSQRWPRNVQGRTQRRGQEAFSRC